MYHLNHRMNRTTFETLAQAGLTLCYHIFRTDWRIARPRILDSFISLFFFYTILFFELLYCRAMLKVGEV